MIKITQARAYDNGMSGTFKFTLPEVHEALLNGMILACVSQLLPSTVNSLHSSYRDNYTIGGMFIDGNGTDTGSTRTVRLGSEWVISYDVYIAARNARGRYCIDVEVREH